jgi:hypothetical protein
MTEEAREEGFRMTKPGWGAVVLVPTIADE